MEVERPKLKLFVLVVALPLGAGLAYQAGYRQGEVAGLADADRRANRKTDELIDALTRTGATNQGDTGTSAARAQW